MPSSFRKTPVLYRDRTLAFLAQDWEIARLARYDCVRVEWNAREEVKSAVLCVKLALARTILSAKHIADSGKITRNKQDNGAAKWVQRPDMAGRSTGTLPAKTLHFKLAHARVERGRRCESREIAS